MANSVQCFVNLSYNNIRITERFAGLCIGRTMFCLDFLIYNITSWWNNHINELFTVQQKYKQSMHITTGLTYTPKDCAVISFSRSIATETLLDIVVHIKIDVVDHKGEQSFRRHKLFP